MHPALRCSAYRCTLSDQPSSPTKILRGNSMSSQLVKEDVDLNLRYHVMTIGSGNDQWEASLECDGGSGGCEDPRAGFGVTQEEAEAAAIAAARKSASREVDGRWLAPFCYWRACYWQAISTAKPAHSQQRADSSLRPGQKQRIITWNNPEQRPFSRRLSGPRTKNSVCSNSRPNVEPLNRERATAAAGKLWWHCHWP